MNIISDSPTSHVKVRKFDGKRTLALQRRLDAAKNALGGWDRWSLGEAEPRFLVALAGNVPFY